MVKRITILAVLLGSLATVGVAQAGCPSASAGHRGGGTVKAQRVLSQSDEGYVLDPSDTVTLTLDTRFVDVCDDGNVIVGETVILGAPTTLSITGADDSCSVETTSDWDPFGFGVGIHDASTDCGADMSFSGFTSPWVPDPARSGVFGESVRLVLSKTTNHENGKVMIHGKEYRAHQVTGMLWTGVGADA